MARGTSGWALGLVVVCSACAVADGQGEHRDHDGHEDTSPELGVLRQALGPDATVADAIASECSTASIRGLGQQLIDEVQCERPGTFSRIDDIPNVVLGSATFPWLQTAAANALRVVASKREATMTINSSYRTVAQQLMLYRWYRNGKRCGIALAAVPGNSNHESALAVDVDEYSAWRTTFQGNDFRWLGSGDPVHFDYAGDDETVDLRARSVAAFQRLWNRNHPDDSIEEDGDYGPSTEARILKAPAGGFALGAPCIQPETDAGPPGEGDVDSGGTSPGPRPDDGVDGGSSSFTPVPPNLDSEGGCSAQPPGANHAHAAWLLILLASVLAARRLATSGTPAARR